MIHSNIIQELENKVRKAQEDYLKFLRDAGYIFTYVDVYGDYQVIEYYALHPDYQEKHPTYGYYVVNLEPQKYPKGAVVRIMFPITTEGYLDLT